MTKFKIGQKVRCIDNSNHAGKHLVSGAIYLVTGHFRGEIIVEGIDMSWRASRFVAVDEDSASPIRTRREIVPGVYGCVEVDVHSFGMNVVADFSGGKCTPAELREAAHLFNQIAEVLEENAG